MDEDTEIRIHGDGTEDETEDAVLPDGDPFSVRPDFYMVDHGGGYAVCVEHLGDGNFEVYASKGGSLRVFDCSRFSEVEALMRREFKYTPAMLERLYERRIVGHDSPAWLEEAAKFVEILREAARACWEDV